jgi:hypothetical protein
MKKISLIVCIGWFSFASAQNNTDTFWVKPIQPKPKTNTFELPKTYKFNYSPQVLDKAKLLETLPNGNKVYALPLDNMPCVVPDMSQYFNTPVKSDTSYYNIPNPAFPSPDKPEVITQDQLNKLLEKYKKQNSER